MAERPILGVGGQLQEGVKDVAVMHLDERTSARQATGTPKKLRRSLANVSEAELRARGIGRPPNPTCRNGHAMTPDNVIRNGHGRRRCRTCMNAEVLATRERRSKEAAQRQRVADDPLYFKRRELLRRYGITYEDYVALRTAQGGLCAICSSPGSPAKNGKRPDPLCIDHDHATGRVRALLCHRCNVRLHVVEDSGFLAAANEYLRRHNGQTT